MLSIIRLSSTAIFKQPCDSDDAYRLRSLTLNDGSNFMPSILSTLSSSTNVHLSKQRSNCFHSLRANAQTHRTRSQQFQNALQSKRNHSAVSPSITQSLSQSEQLLLQEFLSICSTKIQSAWRGYICRKRHRYAIGKVRKFKESLAAVVKGWKTRQVLARKRVFQLKQAAILLMKQLDASIDSPQPGISRTKKIAYLQNQLDVACNLLHEAFQKQFQLGTWIYEVASEGALAKRRKYLLSSQSASQRITSQKQKSPSIAQRNTSKMNNQVQQRNLKPISVNNQNEEIVKNSAIKTPKPNTLPKVPLSTEIEKPIVAKGKYVYDEQQSIQTQSQTQVSSGILNEDEPPKQISINREVIKKKMEKRQKYDPRKAIAEEKLRKEAEVKDSLKQVDEASAMLQQPIKKVESKKSVAEQKQTKPVQTSKPEPKKPSKNTTSIQKPLKTEGSLPTEQNSRGVIGQKSNIIKKPSVSPQKLIKDVEGEGDGDLQRMTQSIHDKIKKALAKTTVDKMTGAKEGTLDKNKQTINVPEVTGYPTNVQSSNVSNLLKAQREIHQPSRDHSQQEAPPVRVQGFGRIQIQPQGFQHLQKQFESLQREAYPQIGRTRISPRKDRRHNGEQHRTIEELETAYSNQYAARMNQVLPKLEELHERRLQEASVGIPVLTPECTFSNWLSNPRNVETNYYQTSIRLDRLWRQFSQG